MQEPFHDHLDVCRQCLDHPCELCPTGAALLRQAVMDFGSIVVIALLRLSPERRAANLLASYEAEGAGEN